MRRASTLLFLVHTFNLLVCSVSCKPVAEANAAAAAAVDEEETGAAARPSGETRRDERLASIVESMKEEFLRSLNLSGIPLHEPSSSEPPPQFMVDLYNRFANDRSSMPSSNIVRSFKNEDSSSFRTEEDAVRQHALLFNVSLPPHELVTMAELKLRSVLDSDHRLLPEHAKPLQRSVSVYEVCDEEEEEGSPVSGRTVLSFLASRTVVGRGGGGDEDAAAGGGAWETFDITSTVQRWARTGKSTHRLEVHIETLEEARYRRSSDGQGDGVGATAASEPQPGEPLLVVFSDDRSRGRATQRQAELDEMIDHEREEPLLLQEVLGAGEAAAHGLGDVVEEVLNVRQNILSYETLSRYRRHAKRNYCKRTPLFVSFKEIGWDSWIIAPPGYDAYECTGQCIFPLTDHLSPTKHAIVKTLMHLAHPDKVAKACCVPTKLDSISILYRDEAGVVTYKYKYEGMVVSECGCR
uniref:Bone morphogenetic protein 10-like n=1 Tax=Petromyzon marinus TaxID=7757 RepID=A0AAJ7SV07_PETMA|nr:bone morphogenetic protein 10-like [Petromyzon marinus]